MKEKKPKTTRNYYKYTTFGLLAILLLAFIAYEIQFFGNQKYESGVVFGQQNAVGIILKTTAENDFVTIPVGESNVTLVPAPLVQSAQEQTILTIMETVKQDGYVILYDNETEMVLIRAAPKEFSIIEN